MKIQNGGCAICGSYPKTRSLHVDHEHVKNFKKLPPEEKKIYVRGLLCFRCNKVFMMKGMTRFLAERIVKYFDNYNQKFG
jgi:hypothetical protein